MTEPAGSAGGATTAPTAGTGGATPVPTAIPNPPAAGNGGAGGTAMGGGGAEAGGTGGMGGAATGGMNQGGESPGGMGGAPPAGQGAPAANIQLTELEFNQAIAIPIAEDGMPIPAPDRVLAGDQRPKLVKGRGGLFRAFWETEPEFVNRELEAVLTLSYADGAEETLSSKIMVDGEPDRLSLDGAFNWTLTGEQVKAGMSYSVAVLEATQRPEPAPATPPRIPSEGLAELGVPENDMILELTIVGVTMNGVEPNLTPENVEQIRLGYMNMLPVSEVRVELRREFMTPDGDSIGQVLNATEQARRADNPPDNVYYIGFADVEIVDWAGVATTPGRAAASPMSKTVNFPEEDTLGFCVHETGHNLGSLHNPGCGPGNDQDWPYGENTKINTQGYRLDTGDLLGADKFEDIMNYCAPDWPSPFTYMLMHEEIEKVTGNFALKQSRPRPTNYVLSGFAHTGGEGHWFAAPAYPIEGAQQHPTFAQLELSDGTKLEVEGGESYSHDIDGWLVDVELPVPVSEIAQITIWAGGEWRNVETEGLTAGYDEQLKLVNQRAD